MTNFEPESEGPDQEFLDRMSELENEARKMGLYMQGFVLGQGADERGEPTEYAMASFMVGEEAFSDRLMNPEKYEEDGQFRQMTATIDPIDDMTAEIEKRIAEGKDPFGED